MCPRPCVSETEVVVLPSPAFVGVIAVTSMSLPSGWSAQAVEDGERDLGLVAAVRVVLVLGEAEGLGDLGDRTKLSLLGDLEAGRHLRGHTVSFFSG